MHKQEPWIVVDLVKDKVFPLVVLQIKRSETFNVLWIRDNDQWFQTRFILKQDG